MWEHQPLGIEKNKENLCMLMRTRTNWNLIWNHSGLAGLKEGAVVAVGEQPLQKRKRFEQQEGR
jgi:hypothetical protein